MMARKQKAPPGYIGLGTHYFSLPFLLTLSFGILALILLYVTALHPVVVRRWYSMQNMPELSINSPYLAEFSGNARLLLPDGTLLYEGAIENAAAQGNGKLYENGELIYEGGFAANEFSGHGRLFYDGEIVYEGGFEKNEFAGVGKLYDNGLLVYEGYFANGQRDGVGTQYDGGRVIYTGVFSAGLYSGAGKLYSPEGKLQYDGDFLLGLFDGRGKLYENGVLKYEGEFAAGMYNGTGTEFNTETGHPVFSGKYSDNERMKAGVLYDENGVPIIPSEVPAARPDPVSLLGKSYLDVLTHLTQAAIVVKEQTADNAMFVIDEEIGVIYSFRIMDDGVPDYLSCIYYYGLLSVGGVVVGADISDIPGGLTNAESMNMAELLVLTYSNLLWGRDATANKLQSMVYVDNLSYTVTAFYLPPELPAPVASDAEKPENEALEGEPGGEQMPIEPVSPPKPSGRILFLRIDYIFEK